MHQLILNQVKSRFWLLTEIKRSGASKTKKIRQPLKHLAMLDYLLMTKVATALSSSD
jgi:hypothetical protein